MEELGGIGTPTGVMAQDLARRTAGIAWPKGFTPETADLFSHNELVIDAPPEAIWRHIIDAASWPDWYPNAAAVEMFGGAALLGPEVIWRWTTFDLVLESRVIDCLPSERLSWYGGAPGAAPAFCHAWLLRHEAAGCRVITEEVGIGPEAAAFRAADEGRMHRGHELWLTTLRWVAEGG